MLTHNDILKVFKQNQSQFSSWGVEKIGIFGSFAGKSAGEKSDVDVLVHFAQDQITFNNYMDLKIFLEETFHRKVDLVVEEDIREELREEILNSVIYAA